MQESEAVTFPENAWVHVAVVHGGDGTATLFLNGRNCAKGPVALPSHVPRGACLHSPPRATPATCRVPVPATPPRAALLRFPFAETAACVAANYYVGRSHWGRDPFFKGEMRDVLVMPPPTPDLTLRPSPRR